MSDLVRDLRYGVRSLRGSPGFTLLAVLTLALGIGPNTGIFTALNEVLLRPVPDVTEPEQLVLLRRAEAGRDTAGFSHEGYKDYRDHATVFSGLMGFRGADLDLSAGDRPEAVDGLLVTGNYFSVLGLRASHGRLIGPEDDRVPGAHPVAVVSGSLWRRRFGGDPHIVGKNILLNGLRYAVIGVALPSFRGTEWGSKTDVWLPLAMERQVRPQFEVLNSRMFPALDVIGRLKPGISRRQAQAELDVLAAQFEEPRRGTKPRVIISPGIRMPPEWTAFAVGFLSVLMATVSLVLIVACANVANLMLARTTRRASEIAVRLAIGARRGHIVRQLLVESLLLSVPAGALGVLIAFCLSGLFAPLFGDWAALREAVHPTDPRVLAYTLAVSVITSVAFGIAPALSASRQDLVSTLKGAGAASRARRSPLRRALIITQVAVSLVAIVVAALFVRTLRNLRTADPGYDPREVFFLQVKLRPVGYSEMRGGQFYPEIVERIRAVPGVRAVALADSMPPGWMWGGEIELEGRPLRSGERPFHVGKNTVGPGYFETLGAPLVAGRGFHTGDTRSSARVAVINETMARRLWPGESAVGKRFRWIGDFGPRLWIEVIGIARDGKYESLAERAQPHVCVPFAQNYEPNMKVVVRAADLNSVIPAVTREFHAFDQNLPAPVVRTAAEHLSESLATERVNASAISLSGMLAVLLAAVGLYGVVSYTVAQRTHEIGIRMALGARPADIIRPVVSEGIRLTAAGVAVGIVLALAAARLLASHLYGVGPADAASFTAGAVVLAGMTILACWIPARRALRIDPMNALRCE